jgi:protein phosphatase
MDAMKQAGDMGEAVPLLFSNKSHVGTVRDENEDYLGYFRAGRRYVFLVADGMGGAVAGAVASRTAVEAAEASLRRDLGQEPTEVLGAAVEAANMACMEVQRKSPSLDGLGTTLDLVLLDASQAWWAHVGDGRIYHVRGGRCILLTKDHSVVQKMVDDGLLDPDEAETHPHRHVLCRAIGRGERVEPDLAPGPVEVAEGDSLVLCSDGLTEVVAAREIGRVAESLGPERACERLVNLALARGASDNVTVQVVYRGSPRRSWRRRTLVCGGESAIR